MVHRARTGGVPGVDTESNGARTVVYPLMVESPCSSGITSDSYNAGADAMLPYTRLRSGFLGFRFNI